MDHHRARGAGPAARRRPLRLALRVLALLLLAWVGLVGLLWLLQDGLVFHPRPAGLGLEIPGAEPLEVRGEGPVLRGHLVPGEGEGPRPALVYFGGNAEDVSRRVRAHPWIARRGIHLVLVAWRGYGHSEGAPSGAGVVADARRVLETVAARPDVDSGRIVLWGSSLGSGPAVIAAAEREVAGLILFAPYDRLGAVASSHYPWIPVSWIFRHEIDAAAVAERVEAPALVVHGTGDRIVPHDRGRALEVAFGGVVRRLDLPGRGHHFSLGTPGVRAAFEDFLDAVLGG